MLSHSDIQYILKNCDGDKITAALCSDWLEHNAEIERLKLVIDKNKNSSIIGEIHKENRHMENTYDLVSENFTTIQQLVMGQAANFRKEGVSKGRALILAADYVGANLLSTPVSGDSLERWLGQQLGALKKNGHNGHAPDNGAVYMDEDAYGLFGKKLGGQMRVAGYLNPLQPNQIVLIPCKDMDEAKHFQVDAGHVTRRLWGKANYASTIRTLEGKLYLAVQRKA
jgi:hypothetical protein